MADREGLDEQPPLFLVKGSASAEEVAALTVVFQALASRAAASRTVPQSEWSSPRRGMRATHCAGPGAWRASALPR